MCKTSETIEKSSPELDRFDKAVEQCREYLRNTLGTKGSVVLSVDFEAGRITHLAKHLTGN